MWGYLVQHPVDILYENLTIILKDERGESIHTDSPCSCCQRPANTFDHVGYTGLDSYNQTFIHCSPCRVMNVSHPDIMGIERVSGSKKIPGKFGMMPGVGWVHELEAGRSTLLAPPGVFVKLPPRFFEQVNVVEMTTGGHLQWIADNATFPLLYIQSFGRKTAALMRGLTISRSPNALVICSDEGMDSVTRSNFTIDLDAALSLSTGLAAMPSPERNGFTKLVRDISNGRITPREASEQIAKKPAFGPLFRLLPADPHQRLQLISIADRLKQ